MSHRFVLVVKGDQVVVFIAERKRPWADTVQLSAMARLFFLFGGPISVKEGDLTIIADCLVDAVDGIIYRLVFRFYTV